MKLRRCLFLVVLALLLGGCQTMTDWNTRYLTGLNCDYTTGRCTRVQP